MATTFRKPGHTITIAAPSGGVTAGTPFLLGTKVCIPVSTAAETVSVECMISGVHLCPKANTQAWTQNEKLYWDDTGKAFTTSATNNTDTGSMAASPVAATGGLVTGLVLLNGLPGCCD